MRNYKQSLQTIRATLTVILLTFSLTGLHAQITNVSFNASTDKSGEEAATSNVSISKDCVTLTASKGSFNKKGYYSVFSDNSLTIKSSEGKIVRIIITCTVKGTDGPGRLVVDGYKKESNSSKKGIWRGESNSVTLKTKGWVAITNIEVRLDGNAQLKSQPGYRFEKATLLTSETIVGHDENKLFNVPSGVKVEYSVDDTNVATVDKATGNVTILKPGDVTVTASSTSTYEYYDYSTSYELKAIEAGTTGEKKDIVIWSEDFSDITYPNGNSTFDLPADEAYPANNASYYSYNEKYTSATIYKYDKYAGGLPGELYLKGDWIDSKFTVEISDLRKAYGNLKLSFLSNKEFSKNKTAEYRISVAGSKGIKIPSKVNVTGSGTKFKMECTIYVPRGATSLKIIFQCTGAGNARLDNFLLTATDFALDIKTNEGYTTFYADEAFIMPEELEGSIIGYDENREKLTYNYQYQPGSTVPADTPLILHSKTGKSQFTINYTETTALNNNSKNCLHGSTTDELASDIFNSEETLNYYILTYDNNTEKTDLGFYWSAEDGSANFINKAGKAFLALPKSLSGIKGFAFETDTVDGINTALQDKNDEVSPIYTISGIRVTENDIESLPSGIYIIGKKKVIVR